MLMIVGVIARWCVVYDYLQCRACRRTSLSLDRAYSNYRLFDDFAGSGLFMYLAGCRENSNLLLQLGPSALAGFSLFVLLVPIQERLMTLQHRRRRRVNIWTDARASLLLEVLGGMRVVKYFCYEIPFLKRRQIFSDVASHWSLTRVFS